MNKDFWNSTKPDWILCIPAMILTILLFLFFMTGWFE